MKREFDDILNDFEPVSEVEQEDTVNGGVLLLYGIGFGAGSLIEDLFKKYTIGPKP